MVATGGSFSARRGVLLFGVKQALAGVGFVGELGVRVLTSFSRRWTVFRVGERVLTCYDAREYALQVFRTPYGFGLYYDHHLRRTADLRRRVLCYRFVEVRVYAQVNGFAVSNGYDFFLRIVGA